MNGVIDLFEILAETDNVLADSVKHCPAFCGLDGILVETRVFE
jgi:hypothetical protein